MPAKKTTPFDSVRDRAREMGEDVKKTGRNVWLAGLGVVATAEEQARDVYDRMVTKGEEFENRDDSTLGKVVDKTTDRVKTLGRNVEEGVQKSVATVLHRVGIPSQKEIHTLIDRVEELTKKVEAMRA